MLHTENPDYLDTQVLQMADVSYTLVDTLLAPILKVLVCNQCNDPQIHACLPSL